jgi:hypothetical protein
MYGAINTTVPLFSKSQPLSQPVRQKFQAGGCISVQQQLHHSQLLSLSQQMSLSLHLRTIVNVWRDQVAMKGKGHESFLDDECQDAGIIQTTPPSRDTLPTCLIHSDACLTRPCNWSSISTIGPSPSESPLLGDPQRQVLGSSWR